MLERIVFSSTMEAIEEDNAVDEDEDEDTANENTDETLLTSSVSLCASDDEIIQPLRKARKSATNFRIRRILEIAETILYYIFSDQQLKIKARVLFDAATDTLLVTKLTKRFKGIYAVLKL